MPVTPPRRLPDPHGMIARIRGRLNKKCAVRISPFCDYIISMRMQGVPFREIEDWLIKQGEQHRISDVTIWRNLKNTKLEVKLTYAEEMIEKMGGTQVQLNLIRELSQNIVTQKERIDRLVRAELEKRKEKGFENYNDRRIRQEMELHTSMIGKLHDIVSKMPDEATARAEEEMRKLDQNGIGITADAAAVLSDMIINDEIMVTAYDIAGPSKARH